MARKTPKEPTPVDAIHHADKRANIPTADAHEFVDPSIDEIRTIRYARDESLDPQLIWRGKYPSGSESHGYENDLLTDAPPIYIQEKIDPRVLVEDLRRTFDGPGEEPELSLFESFDGLDEMESVDFYRHDANWSNRMILGDSMHVLASLAEREKLRGKVQMVYIDPPYGIKFGSNWQASTRDRDVKDGKLQDAPREAEQIKAFRDTWELGIHSYLSYLRDRLLGCREILTDSGSCFIQIGDENVHLVRTVMDEVFGADNFISQIAFVTTGGFSTSHLPRNFDSILWYGKTKDIKFNRLFEPFDTDPMTSPYRWVELPDGSTRSLSSAEISGAQPLPVGRYYQPTSLNSQGASSTPQPIKLGDKTYLPPRGNHWKASWPDGMGRLATAGRIHVAKGSLRFKRMADDFPWKARTSVWTDTATGNFTDAKMYVVQTNTKVIERCMLMCTEPGDLVVDPTCGSGTTAFVAEQWGRRWITIDTSRVALALARERVASARYPWYLLADSEDGSKKQEQVSGTAQPRQTFSNNIRDGFVYERVAHVMLRSIANNPDIKEGMSPAEVDRAIRRHADFEILQDKPYENPKKVRVSGPFTVESLSPHRSLAFAGRSGATPSSRFESARTTRAIGFEQSILENLSKAGIQNGLRQERITFAAFENYAGEYIQALGVRATESDTASGKIAIAIGPQYGTVSPAFVKKAAREAIGAEEVDLLCILGFAFDAQVTGITKDDGVTVEASAEGFANVAATRKLGRIPVLMVRMNVDLLMGEELKKTGVGNLFTVFGEPDLTVDETPAGIVVELRGVDVYDPTTGEVRSNDTSRIALWMIDTDYDEESFFVRHCYFTGGNDPFKRLKVALRADIDADSWESLYQTVSRPFAKPATGKIAVKVINDYGDEVMKVFDV